MKQVVLVRLAAGAPDRVDVKALRDYIAESIELGVLVLGPGADLSVVDLPDPGQGLVYVNEEPLRVREDWPPADHAEYHIEDAAGDDDSGDDTVRGGRCAFQRRPP